MRKAKFIPGLAGKAALLLTGIWCSVPNRAGADAMDWLPAPDDSSTMIIASDAHGDILGDWLLHPRYVLPGSAANWLGPVKRVIPAHHHACDHDPKSFMGHLPTQRLCHLIAPKHLPSESFSLEFWINDHVSEAIAMRLSARAPEPHVGSAWSLSYDSRGYSYRRIIFNLKTADQPEGHAIPFSSTGKKDGFLEYWRHVVAIYDGHEARLYVNGRLQGQSNLPGGELLYLGDAHLELAGYFAREPYMELANLIRHLRVYRKPLTEEEISRNFSAFRRHVEEGIVFPGTFHFNAGPYISFVDQTSAGIVWETDRPSRSTVSWGKDFPLTESVEVSDEPRRIQRVRLTGLEADTPYFYSIASRDEDNCTIDTGLLTFKTACREGQPFRFAVIGDTETRPHINQRLGRLIWDERPSFVMNLGDLTDGGKEPEKFQWNYEYFVGVTPLASRVPFFTVPGNGEGDLYWYNRYHVLPEDRTPYRFRFGDAEFFMMDSNQRKNEFAPGGRQYVWLEQALRASKAKWRFVAFHHAPYTSEADDYGDSWKGVSQLGDLDVRRLVPVFEQHGVDMVMFGHLHLYERTWPIRDGQVRRDGVVYLLCGGGGGNLEEFAPNPAFFTTKTHRGHHYCTIELFHDQLMLRMYDLDGDLRDQATMTDRPSRVITHRGEPKPAG